MKGATSIQERLWELRKDKGLNLEELSKLTGISKSALGSYEKEDFKEINHGNLITLADFYGVSVDYLHKHQNSKPTHLQKLKRISVQAAKQPCVAGARGCVKMHTLFFL